MQLRTLRSRTGYEESNKSGHQKSLPIEYRLVQQDHCIDEVGGEIGEVESEEADANVEKGCRQQETDSQSSGMTRVAAM